MIYIWKDKRVITFAPEDYTKEIAMWYLNCLIYTIKPGLFTHEKFITQHEFGWTETPREDVPSEFKLQLLLLGAL